MKGYVVCVYKSISSEEKLKEYAVKARAAVEIAADEPVYKKE